MKIKQRDVLSGNLHFWLYEFGFHYIRDDVGFLFCYFDWFQFRGVSTVWLAIKNQLMLVLIHA